MSAAPFLVGLLLIASGATAAGNDGACEISHLELPAIPDWGRGHGPDAPPPPPPLQGLMDIMSTSGCGSFGALLAATPNASDIFLKHLVAGGAGGGGLTVFCPDDHAVGAIETRFRALSKDSGRIAFLLHHGAAGRYVRARLAGFDWVTVPSLAVADAATNEMQTVLVRHLGDTMRLWPTWPTMARVTASSEEAHLVLHVVDAVLVRQNLDGGEDEAAVRGGWLHPYIWEVLFWVEVAILCFLAGWQAQNIFRSKAA